MKREPNITEQQAREIVEKMGHKESYTPKSMNDLYRRIGLEPDEPEQHGKTVTEETKAAVTNEPSGVAVEETATPQKRVSSKQRRLSLEEYRTTYLQVPKIVNRKPVFVSETVRDELDRIVRYLGGKGMSASGLIENLVRLHLDIYRNDIELWRKL
ncbi:MULTISPECIES: DUF3408 domain-containing protein [Bacteroidales]|uniref:DUF3408 domain-containing protein n=1 Tax=Bacteroidales TaxID=171549 RepID=UPI00189EAA88|nr:DUF3408 domain-containing protein [Parabacteroides distasonis]MDB9151219.1 DUF3408 domain-containing protein [Parabacteroides distasonis]MDB9155729.1 DUF3408 domain-containing protein [Parabacteroides distasonis]MDB9164748.1 DUF3408 domain-containing protein [Parabacteroides distasonis]MDB9169279.1 DUF3408 domain-containing protein [Parabacteroides distasonis]MDB9197565.1 DUF3408 domain-containing protein [Parabacteroides distasonis]